MVEQGIQNGLTFREEFERGEIPTAVPCLRGTISKNDGGEQGRSADCSALYSLAGDAGQSILKRETEAGCSSGEDKWGSDGATTSTSSTKFSTWAAVLWKSAAPGDRTDDGEGENGLPGNRWDLRHWKAAISVQKP